MANAHGYGNGCSKHSDDGAAIECAVGAHREDEHQQKGNSTQGAHSVAAIDDDREATNGAKCPDGLQELHSPHHPHRHGKGATEHHHSHQWRGDALTQNGVDADDGGEFQPSGKLNIIETKLLRDERADAVRRFARAIAGYLAQCGKVVEENV